MIGRALAWILLVLAVIVGGHDALTYLKTGTYAPTELGALWYQFDRGSLNLVQAVIERYIHPILWQDLIFPFLVWPAWLVLGSFAVLFGMLSGMGSGKRKRRRGFG